MKVVKDLNGVGKIEIIELKEMAKRMFGNLVKAVVDIEKEIMAVDGEMHADEVELLIQNGSEPKNLWGINIYPEINGEGFIEFDSIMNLKPAFNNRTRGVEDADTREKIIKIVKKLCSTKI